MKKSYRQGQILKLVHYGNIHTQEDLARELKKLGIAATQVTLSRDIRELGLAKTPGGYKQVTPEPAGPNVAAAVAELLLDAREAQNLVVLKTSPGHASPLALALDHAGWPEVLGTVAGDDTILVICPDAPAALKVHKKLLQLR